MLDTIKTGSKERITSIDALRAVVLFGIILLHTSNVFGWNSLESSSWGIYAKHYIFYFLADRCKPIFGMLFGVSFYLILRNPNYPSRRFVWRCFLLFLIGLFNKIFFTNDILMWYGLSGMALTCFRNLSIKKLWISFIVIYILNLVINQFFDFKSLLFGSNFVYDRYSDGKSLTDILCYPVWLSAYYFIRGCANNPFQTLSIFLLGYCIAKSGIIDNLKKHVSFRNLIIATVIYGSLVYLEGCVNVLALEKIKNLCGAIWYALLFLMLYYKTYPFFRFLEPYGKLGLTNYSMQGIVGIVLAGIFFVPYHISFEYYLLTMILFYVVQVVFSIIWLRYYKYGPFEWLWRCATEKRWIKNKL